MSVRSFLALGATVGTLATLAAPAAYADNTVPAGSSWRVYGQYTGGCATIVHVGSSDANGQKGCRTDGYVVEEWQMTAVTGMTFGVRVTSNGASTVDCAIGAGEGEPPIVHQNSQSGGTVECVVTVR